MAKKSIKNILLASIGLGVYHIALHFVGINFVPDPKANFLYFVTPGLVIGYAVYKYYFEK